MHSIIKYTILFVHIAKTILLAINNYLYFEDRSLAVIRDAEFGLKLLVDFYIYPLFLICLNFYVKNYKE